jgi:acyl-CoA reductase-like NAD-dependent aldehyde dehydrogenase
MIGAAMQAARAAQPGWQATPVAERLAILRRARHALARECRAFAARAVRPGMDEAQVLLAEVMPLLAAIRFLEREAPRLLAPRRPAGRRPAWLWGTRLVVHRVPHGLVLVIGPGNYPLLLAGVHALQALAAGNAVALKPAPGWAGPMLALRAALVGAGLPEALLAVLPDGEAAGREAVEAGPDHVVLTGAEATGRAVAGVLGPLLIPAILELSGDDAVIVLPGADLAKLEQALGFALAFNGGNTCIAPRRLISVGTLDRALPLAAQVVPDVAAGIALANASPFALGAAIWGEMGEAQEVARRLRAGCVVINDLILPTADPRLPFGGAGSSGYGVTRGAEGLLALTRPQAVVARRRPFALPWRPLPVGAARWIARGVRALYG